MINEEIIQKQEELFKEWEEKPLHKDKVFIRDGIIDIESWQKTDKKIVFLLKEAYGTEKYDLAKLIRNDRKCPKYKMWWTVSYWLYVLNETTANLIPKFSDFYGTEEGNEKCKNYLLSSAFVNVKKSNGESFSNDEDLKKYMISDKDLLMRQLELYAPNIIICGSTKWLLEGIWNKDKPITEIKNTQWIYQSEGMKIIDFYHPANQYPLELCYYTLGYLYQRALNEQL
jgi:hypothetical protein